MKISLVGQAGALAWSKRCAEAAGQSESRSGDKLIRPGSRAIRKSTSEIRWDEKAGLRRDAVRATLAHRWISGSPTVAANAVGVASFEEPRSRSCSFSMMKEKFVSPPEIQAEACRCDSSQRL